MKLLNLAWDTVTNVGQRDHDTLRLILDEKLPNPILTSDKRGPIVKLPVPRALDEDKFSLHGLHGEERSWPVLWRLFKASLYHASLHVAFSDFPRYAEWARGKDVNTATYSVSLVEDLNVTLRATKRWPGLIPDLVYSNYISSLRIRDANAIQNPSLRFATKLLLGVWGLHGQRNDRVEEDREAQSVASTLRRIVSEANSRKADEAKAMLLDAAQNTYAAVIKRGPLPEVPYFPHTEAHGPSSVFAGGVIREPIDSRRVPASAYEALGLKQHGVEEEKRTLDEAAEAYESILDTRGRTSRILQKYRDLISATRLDGVEFPSEDYGMFLRIRSDLAGPIRTIRDQLSVVKNVLDDTSPHPSGQLDMPEAVQVLAARSTRSDVFQREEIARKDEAWGILVDTSRSISSFSHEAKGIATCLSEVAKGLITTQSRWGMYAFNSTLQIVKDFDEEHSLNTQGRIGGLVQKNITLLPDALMSCHKILASRAVDTRILVVVSDGYPTGYADIEKKLVSTIKEISRSGTLLIGVGVDSDAIEEYFTVNCVLDNPYHMMKGFVKAYLELSSSF